MRTLLQFLLALTIAALVVLGIRSLAFTVYTVEGNELAPELLQGDHILVNRWSYGLRTGSQDGLFPYGRILGRKISRGDIVAFDSPLDSLPGLFVCRCTALPGDTIRIDSDVMMIPGREATCAAEDYYWMESLSPVSQIDSRVLGPVPESCIVGRVCLVLYSHDVSYPLYDGYRSDRFLLRIEP